MAAQRFVVSGLPKPVVGWAMGVYRPYWIREDGRKTQNPKFDRHSGYILDVKGKNPGQKPLAYCASLLLRQLAEMPQLRKAEILVVPSSTKGQWSTGLEQIAQMIAKGDKRFTFRPKALRRTRDIEKLAGGGDRSLAVHLESLEYDWDIATSTPKIILDDVATTGNSIAGCITVIQDLFLSDVQTTPLVLGKTSHD
jgi:hypothetical protein